jgi:poly-beta-1,6-N-acetyl-D-glucosamine synthase
MSVEEVSKYVFFISLGLLLYTYIGYGLLAGFIGMFSRRSSFDEVDFTTIPLTIIIPAYNEAGVLEEKINNTFLALTQFKNAQVILITDGSNDGSGEMNWSNYPLLHLHGPERKGKSSAINESMLRATGEIVIITDANAMVNKEAFEKLVMRFHNQRTGAVSGEKKVLTKDGSTGGEGLYWKYESFLKRNSARMYSLTGAAGELLAFRRELFMPIPEDAILDDMELSLSIIKQGKVIDYEPMAFAIEPPSRSIKDEFMRKVRISAGVFQTLKRNLFVFNPFKHAIFIFQFNSHRVLRWTIGLLCLILLYASNLALIGYPASNPTQLFFDIIFIGQNLFYLFILFGLLVRNNKKIPTFIFLPFYFMMMNIAVVVGFFRFLSGSETVLWKKANR